jgi:VWFA-related protein
MPALHKEVEMKSRRKYFSCVVIIAAMMFPNSASAKPKDKSADKENAETRITARAELVLVPTLVTDKSGNHVKGLTREDFRLLENGAEQKIATFEEVTSDAHRLPRPRNPNEFTNSLAAESTHARVTIIVLDLINTPLMAQADARKELLNYLTQTVDQREPTGLYTLTRSGIRMIHDFTTDPRILIAALHMLKGEAYELVDSPEDVEAITGTASPEGSAYPGSPTAAPASHGSAGVASEAQRLQSMMEDSELNFQAFEQRIAITYTLDGMQEIAQALAGIPGRKSLIWATGGFPFNVSDNTMQLVPYGRDSLSDVLPMYEHTWQLLNEAQIALYSVDVKGLQVTTLPSASLRNPGKNFRRSAVWRELDTQATFQTFASMTGGRVYFNSNDLAKGFRDAVNDSAEYYMLGYYLDRSTPKSGWRKLAVKVKRDHVEVRARSGFFVTEATTDPENARKADISLALQSPLDYTSLTLVTRWTKVEPGKEPGKKHVNYEMQLSPDAGVINQADNNRVVLDFVALAKTPEGKLAGPPMGQKVDVHLSPERLPKILQQGVVYRDALDLAPGEYTVRFVVRDDLSGRTGSVAAPLKVE